MNVCFQLMWFYESLRNAPNQRSFQSVMKWRERKLLVGALRSAGVRLDSELSVNTFMTERP